MNDSSKPPVIKVMEMREHAPGYKDPADLFERHPNPGPVWEKMIAEARTVPSWMIEHIDDVHDISTPEGASEACADIVDTLLLRSPVERARYVRQLAEKIGEDERVVRQTLNDIVKERGDYYAEHPQERPVEEKIPSLEDALGL